VSYRVGAPDRAIKRGEEYFVHDIHIRLSKKTHERLVAHLLRHSKAKNKSELARLLLEEGLGVGTDQRSRPDLAPLLGRLDAIDGRLTEIRELLVRTPAVPQNRPKRKDDASDPANVSRRDPRAAQPASSPRDKDPKKMTPAERAVWKDALLRELTGQD
jgi:hypothetical protein